MVGSNILTTKQLEKMTNEKLIDFRKKLQDNLISKQTELINDNKEFPENLMLSMPNSTIWKKRIKLFIKVMIAGKPSTALSISHKKLNN